MTNISIPVNEITIENSESSGLVNPSAIPEAILSSRPSRKVTHYSIMGVFFLGLICFVAFSGPTLGESHLRHDRNLATWKQYIDFWNDQDTYDWSFSSYFGGSYTDFTIKQKDGSSLPSWAKADPANKKITFTKKNDNKEDMTVVITGKSGSSTATETITIQIRNKEKVLPTFYDTFRIDSIATVSGTTAYQTNSNSNLFFIYAGVSGGKSNIYGRITNNKGQEVTAQFALSPDTNVDAQTNPVLAPFGTSAVADRIVVWTEKAGSTYSLYRKVYDDDGNAITATATAIATGYTSIENVQIVALSSSAAVVAWYANDNSIHACIISNAGSVTKADFVLANGKLASGQYKLMKYSNDNFAVGFLLDNKELHVATFTAAGAVHQAEQTIATNVYVSGADDFDFDEFGTTSRLVFVYTGSGSELDIRTAWYDAATGTFHASTVVKAKSGIQDTNPAVYTVPGTTRMVVTWVTKDGSNYGISGITVNIDTSASGATSLSTSTPEWSIAKKLRTYPTAPKLQEWNGDTVAVIWAVTAKAYDVRGVWLAVYDEDGTVTVHPHMYSSIGLTDQINPKLFSISSSTSAKLLIWEEMPTGATSLQAFGKILDRNTRTNILPDIIKAPSYFFINKKSQSKTLPNEGIGHEYENEPLTYYAVMQDSPDYTWDYNPSTGVFTTKFEQTGSYKANYIVFDKYGGFAQTDVKITVTSAKMIVLIVVLVIGIVGSIVLGIFGYRWYKKKKAAKTQVVALDSAKELKA